ncbi:RHS repeat-associated core domain-containing protein [Pseudomonas sp. NPDC007930]|uniref:RHS repeat-associated core domain-containing protein n=1 Tax=Pseudomonas sp. NPDC007930 TaxID=3364417 RepID=UPI0036E42B56
MSCSVRLGCDRARSPLLVLGTAGPERRAHTPFGSALPACGASGFAGLCLAPHGLLLAGHGYRAYAPRLARFVQPDRLSPFGEGGPNAYAYCLADPINHHDPDGRNLVPLLSNVFGTLNLVAYGGLMGFGYRLAVPSRAVLAVDVALMFAGSAAQVAAWASDSAAVSIIGVAATGITALGRGVLAGYWAKQVARPGTGWWGRPAWGRSPGATIETSGMAPLPQRDLIPTLRAQHPPLAVAPAGRLHPAHAYRRQSL